MSGQEGYVTLPVRIINTTSEFPSNQIKAVCSEYQEVYHKSSMIWSRPSELTFKSLNVLQFPSILMCDLINDL